MPLRRVEPGTTVSTRRAGKSHANQCAVALRGSGTILSARSAEEFDYPISTIDLFLCAATATAGRWIVVWRQSLFGHDLPVEDRERNFR